MPFINVILKNGTSVAVPDADEAAWVSERPFPGATESEVRLVCKQGDRVLAKFLGDDVSGYVWRDGKG